MRKVLRLWQVNKATESPPQALRKNGTDFPAEIGLTPLDMTEGPVKGARMSQDVAEVWQIKNNKLVKLTIYFDLAAYRTFMKG